MKKRDTGTASLFEVSTATAPEIRRTVRIEFDGGTPCNIPRLGYGDGYGSYKVDSEPIYRLNFRIPMSANVAEITTLRRAVESVAQSFGKEGIALEIHGDSQIALKWARNATESGKRAKMGKGASNDFAGAVAMLQGALEGFAIVKAIWRGRAASVELFGH
jgi:hypothetical protein